ncbi:head-tail connector protein [Kushneria phosphatilytica]|uniref:Phage gp6-like head-tail connector protein n=1 Tax=Kushneria phosphatilytica TaxID=657387 RepID=A0A1S1NZ25_9GAMM|nr:hypothetical protein BH688_05580 [Kushneria phosphatilytica]QEL11318.1 phage gp6-like head-tail connector protein [Kushneria phosphatilytica]
MIEPTQVVSLDTMKAHLRLDHDAEDELISLYAGAALDWCLWYCDNPNQDSADALSRNFKAAMLLVLGDLFANREAQFENSAYTNPTAENLLWADRDWAHRKGDEDGTAASSTYDRRRSATGYR